MLNATLRAADRLLHVEFGDGEALDFPYLWLRDNCPSGFHPQTAEREFDLTQAPEAPSLSAARVEGDAIVLDWAEDGHVSGFPEGWRRAVAPGPRRRRPRSAPAGAAPPPRNVGRWASGHRPRAAGAGDRRSGVGPFRESRDRR